MGTTDVLLLVLVAPLPVIGVAVLTLVARMYRRQGEMFWRQGEAAEVTASLRREIASDEVKTVIDKSINGYERSASQARGYARAQRRKKHLTLVKGILIPSALGAGLRSLWEAHAKAAYALTATAVVVCGATAAVYLAAPNQSDKRGLEPHPLPSVSATQPTPGLPKSSPTGGSLTASTGTSPVQPSPTASAQVPSPHTSSSFPVPASPTPGPTGHSAPSTIPVAKPSPVRGGDDEDRGGHGQPKGQGDGQGQDGGQPAPAKPGGDVDEQQQGGGLLGGLLQLPTELVSTVMGL